MGNLILRKFDTQPNYPDIYKFIEKNRDCDLNHKFKLYLIIKNVRCIVFSLFFKNKTNL